MPGKKELTPKQAMFVREYLVDLNAAAAARRAGFAESVARSKATQWVSKSKHDCPTEYHHIWDAIQEAIAARAEKVEVNAQWVLNQAVKLHERCMQEVVPDTTISGKQKVDDQGRKVFRFDAKGASAALKLVGDHINIQAFKKQVELSGKLDMAEIISKAKRFARKPD